MDIVHDRRGNEIYITDERWEHIHERHPEIISYEAHVLKTLRSGRRKQQPLEPDIFKYSRSYDDLPEGHKYTNYCRSEIWRENRWTGTSRAE